MRFLGNAACRLAMMLGVAVALPAYAVGDLAGGPAVNQYDLHPPASAIAQDQQWLHNFMLVICVAIFLAVFGVMFYSIVVHRKSRGAKAANFHESTTVEILWTIVPFVIVIAMAWPATRVVVAMKDTSSSDLTIKVTGIQWRWGYDYLKGEGEGIGFLSTIDPVQREMSNAGKPSGDDYLLRVDNPLVVPVDKKIRLITTANDVIHAFYVPSLGVQETALPGFVRDPWFRANKIGTFYGQCSQLCGKEHSYMPIQVKVVSQADYTAWVADKTKEAAAKADDPNKVWELPVLQARGEQLYTANCQVCHQSNGKGGGAVNAAALDGSATVLDADHTKEIHVLLNGRNAMPSWKQLSDTEIAALITYTKNHWSNTTGQLVQPTEVAAARK
ncbi:MAG: cytochrome c oxidase subunit II [Acetobacteraceae bacterium]